MRPSSELSAFAVWALEQTIDRMSRSGAAPAPVVWSMQDGKRTAALFEAGADLAAVRDTVQATASLYAIVYAAAFELDGTSTDAIVAEAGDATAEFRYGLLYAWDNGQVVPVGGEIKVSPSGPSRISRP
jgi:hypothetical protein